MTTCPKCKFTFNAEGKTKQQNAYFHLIVSIIAEETGESFEYVKTFLKNEFGFYSWILKSDGGSAYKVYESIGSMSKRRLAELIDNSVMWATSQGINIQTPEEFYTA